MENRLTKFFKYNEATYRIFVSIIPNHCNLVGLYSNNHKVLYIYYSIVQINLNTYCILQRHDELKLMYNV